MKVMDLCAALKEAGTGDGKIQAIKEAFANDADAAGVPGFLNAMKHDVTADKAKAILAVETKPAGKPAK